MFNVIKGNLINKNVKPVIINIESKEEQYDKEDKIKKSIKKEFESFDEVEEKSEELFFQQDKFFDSQNGRNDLDLLEELIREKRNELVNIQKEGMEAINEAQENSKLIIESAREEALSTVNDIKADAWEAGFNQGMLNAKEQAVENSDALIISANKILEEASKHVREIFNTNKEEIIKLSFEIAKKIIKKEVKNKEVLFNNLLGAMKKAQINKELKIFVNWEELTYSKELKEILQNRFQGIESIDIIEDRTLEPGGCIIETKLGKIDASIKNQLKILFNALNEE